MILKAYISRMEMTQRIQFWHQNLLKITTFLSILLLTLQLKVWKLCTFLFFNISGLTTTLTKQNKNKNSVLPSIKKRGVFKTSCFSILWKNSPFFNWKTLFSDKLSLSIDEQRLSIYLRVHCDCEFLTRIWN